ncbi:TatD family hydrolase [Ottowia thiooxydans]
MYAWIDTHCHLDAPEFRNDLDSVRAKAASVKVSKCIIPAVEVATFEDARSVAHRFGDFYALGIHPLYVERAAPDDLTRLDESLSLHAQDPNLVAVGEIGLDYFVPELNEPALKAKQERFYREQLKLARSHALPVILHVRRSVDAVLKGLRGIEVPGGIAHAFNGSQQQAQIFIDMGFKLGFGGAVTYERATRLRELAATLPIESLVLETDAPDIPPHWLYATAQERNDGKPQGRNEPGELPKIAAVIAELRGISEQELMAQTTRNALAAIPGLARFS